MERKKSALSGLFNVINALENILLTIMVVGMIITILLQIGGRVFTSDPAVTAWTEVAEKIQ